MTRRRLSLENEQDKAQWSMRQREANRRIVDTRNNLESIYERQRNLNNAAYIADLEKKQSEIDKKIQVLRICFKKKRIPFIKRMVLFSYK